MSKKSESDLGLYIHIPYCIKKCPYCAFNSFPRGYVNAGYVDSLIKESRWAGDLLNIAGRPLESLYLGGGTPSLLDPLSMEKLINSIFSSYGRARHCEVTLEVNPATNGGEKLKAFRSAGINRLSMGVQSFNDDNLKFLGRLHDAGESEKAFSDARGAGFDNISMDIIFALPGQDGKGLLKELEKAAYLGPEHISLYLLTMEEETPMNERARKREFFPAPDHVQEELFLLAADYLAGRGYSRYETSNYAREGYRSRHNMRYWQGGDYIGLGAGAHSYLSEPGWGIRWWNLRDAGEYETRIKEGLMPLESLEILSREEAVRETVFTALRTGEGLKEGFLRERFGLSLYEVVSEDKLLHIPYELYQAEGGNLSLTDRGALLADDIAERISL
ncbi:MAG: radical SAM family heme chaperone HemW [Deltaproteobacteria bacterium]|nr:radical SAM family heme chaperone HemW [Deltaproteobacteria bacterium]